MEDADNNKTINTKAVGHQKLSLWLIGWSDQVFLCQITVCLLPGKFTFFTLISCNNSYLVTNMLCSRKLHYDEDLQAEASDCNTWCTVLCCCVKTKKIKIDWCAVELLSKNSLFIFLQHSHHLKACELWGLHLFVSLSSVCQHWPYKKFASTCLLMMCGVSKSACHFSKYCHFQPDLKFGPLRCIYWCVATTVITLLSRTSNPTCFSA